MKKVLDNPIITIKIGNMIPRLVESLVIDKLRRLNLVTIILGARQIGKTTLIRSIISRFKNDGQKVIYLNCDLEEDRNNLNTTSITTESKMRGKKLHG